MVRARTVLLSVCVFAAAACGGGGGTPATWSAVLQNQPAALLSAWGSSASDVWVVGGDQPGGGGPIVLHYDGSKWTKMDTGVTGVDLWWDFGFKNGPVFMGGSKGTILVYQNGKFTDYSPSGAGNQQTPSNNTIFGIWGASPNDVWAVGGSPMGGANGFAWHFDGTQWTDKSCYTAGSCTPDQVPQDIVSGGTLFKVSGHASGDVWMVGGTQNGGGVSLDWTGTSFKRSAIPINGEMLSVACNSQRCIAVGGGFNGALYENDGSGWKSKLPPSAPFLNGVAATDSAAYAVGHSGIVLARTSSGAWQDDDTGGATTHDLHADFIDPDGGVWACGGDLENLTDGVLIHKGNPVAGGIQ